MGRTSAVRLQSSLHMRPSQADTTDSCDNDVAVYTATVREVSRASTHYNASDFQRSGTCVVKVAAGGRSNSWLLPSL